MPSRRRGQEANRRARRVARRAPRVLTEPDQVEVAWKEHEDPWCCPDCDTHHPANLLNAAIDEIAAYKKGHEG